LTTENKDSHVETIDDNPAEQTEDQVQETNELSYDEVWDKLDVNDEESVNKLLFNNDESEQPAEETPEAEEKSDEEQEAIDAFMKAAPVLKFKGKDVPIESPDEIIALAQKGFKLETEMAKIKPQKKVLSIVEEIPVEVLQAVADLNAGKQDALEYLREHYGLKEDKADDDMFGDYNDESNKETSTYKPEVKSEDPVSEYFEGYSQENPEVAGKVSSLYKELDQSFQSELYDPRVFPAFVKSVETGEFDEVYPLAMKERVLNPALSWLDAYTSAASKVNQAKPERNDPPASAQVPGNADGKRNVTIDADALWEDDDAYNRMKKDIFGA